MTRTAIHSSWPRAMRLVALALFLFPMLAACGGFFGDSKPLGRAKFTSAKFGVASSPRVITGKYVPKGGGRYQVGQPYKVAGVWYKPKEQPNLDKTGEASWYGSDFHGRRTANGEIFDANGLTAAHPTLPLPSYVRVTNLANNRSVMVRVNDRGPYLGGRDIDISERAADMLGFIDQGTARVRIQYVGKAPLEGDDTRMLVASFNSPTFMERTQRQDTRIALVEAPKVLPRLERAPAKVAVFPAARPTASLDAINASFRSEEASNLMFFAPQTFDRSQSVSGSARGFVPAAQLEASVDKQWAPRGPLPLVHLRFELGIYDPVAAEGIETEFALLGAVDAVPIIVDGRQAKRLTVTTLKPGATQQDLIDLSRTLGLVARIL